MIKNRNINKKKVFRFSMFFFTKFKLFALEQFKKLPTQQKIVLKYSVLSVFICTITFSMFYSVLNPGEKIPNEIFEETTEQDSLYKTIHADKKVTYINLKYQELDMANIIKTTAEASLENKEFDGQYYLYIDWNKSPGCEIDKDICAHKFFSSNCTEACIINPIQKRYIKTSFNSLKKKLNQYKTW